MKFAEPFFVLLPGGLIPTDWKTFLLTRSIDAEDQRIIANVGPSGRSGMEWVLDSQGRFFEMVSRGVMPATVFQKLRLTRRKECFDVRPPRAITVGELKARLAHVRDRFPEAPVAAFTRRMLRKYPEDAVIDPAIMAALLGLDAE